MTLRLTKNNEFLLASIFMLSGISGLLTELMSKMGLSYPTNLAFAIIFSVSIIAWFKMLFMNFRVVVLVATIYALILSVSIVMEPRIIQYIFNFNNGSLYDIAKSEFAYVLFLCLSPFLLGFGRANMDTLFRYLRRYAVVSTILFSALMVVTVRSTEIYNYMSIAYNALPGTCILFLDSRLYSNKLSGLLCLLGAACLLIGGCRGALATLVVLWLVWGLQSLRNMTKQKLVGAAILSAGSIVVLTNLPYFASILDQVFASVGYSSRVIKSLIETSASESFFAIGGRSFLLTKTYNNLNLFGHGIYSDRVLLQTYPHNMLLEIIYHFGWIFGILIIAGGVCLLIYIYCVASRKNDKFLMAAWCFLLSIICAKLMVSSTYLSDFTFWFCLGFLILCFRRANQNGEEQT